MCECVWSYCVCVCLLSLCVCGEKGPSACKRTAAPYPNLGGSMAWDDGALCHRDMRIRSRCGDILQSRFTTKQTIVSLSSSIKANQGCVLNTRSHDVSHSPSSSSTRLSSWLVNYCPTTPVQTSAGEANTGRQIRTKRATQYHLSHACHAKRR